ncbi:DUF2637 domain-containing protein [Nocardiopsis sp. CNT312]|uniref:DUF2637 domain-containing protein n=1 Tax=Nocardiopsis sp. CNT312 TaxID=1137268 RepID=UPI0004B0F520|nr:DUF2637 domain-containing protein [Nocardiopsis sp. CNT312]
MIATVVSYGHVYEAQRHGEPERRSALFPLSVDGMIVVSCMTLLTDARHGHMGPAGRDLRSREPGTHR